MKFAFFTHVPWPEGTDLQQIIAETTEQVQYAEALGFHGAWLAEHHFTRYSMASSSLILATILPPIPQRSGLALPLSCPHYIILYASPRIRPCWIWSVGAGWM